MPWKDPDNSRLPALPARKRCAPEIRVYKATTFRSPGASIFQICLCWSARHSGILPGGLCPLTSRAGLSLPVGPDESGSVHRSRAARILNPEVIDDCGTIHRENDLYGVSLLQIKLSQEKAGLRQCRRPWCRLRYNRSVHWSQIPDCRDTGMPWHSLRRPPWFPDHRRRPR